MEDQKRGPGLACNLDFAKGKGFEPKVKKIFKIVKTRRLGEQTSFPNVSQMGVSGPVAGRFFVIFFLNSYFNAIWITFRTFLKPFEKGPRQLIANQITPIG